MSLCSCKKNPASSEDKPNNSSHTSSFQISGETEFTTSDNIHTYIISQNQGSFQSEKTLTILNKTSGELVQTVSLTENEWFTQNPIYLVDVSFDGHVDIIVPHARPASAAYFQAYTTTNGPVDQLRKMYRILPRQSVVRNRHRRI